MERRPHRQIHPPRDRQPGPRLHPRHGDDNNRKNRHPICRLHLHHAQKYLGVFDANNKEERIPIDTVDDIYKYAERLKQAIGYYDEA